MGWSIYLFACSVIFDGEELAVGSVVNDDGVHIQY